MRAPDFWQEDGALALLLSPAALIFTLGGTLRRHFTRAKSVAVPVVCAGNLVVGGAGKTPVAIALAERLAARGKTVHFLSRGHGGRLRGPLRVSANHHTAAQVGDEPLLLARHAPTWVARDRAAGAEAAARAGAEVIVMDDGLQNPGLHKDLSFLVVDGGYGFGNGRVLPAGPLREPFRAGIRRAQAVIFIGPDERAATQAVPSDMPVLRATVEPAVDPTLPGAAVFAFAGIGRPEKFFATLDQIGCRIIGRRVFPDHHPYADRDIADIQRRAAAAKALAVTTEKDHVRLPAAVRDNIRPLPITIGWGDPAALDRLLDRIL